MSYQQDLWTYFHLGIHGLKYGKYFNCLASRLWHMSRGESEEDLCPEYFSSFIWQRELKGCLLKMLLLSTSFLYKWEL